MWMDRWSRFCRIFFIVILFKGIIFLEIFLIWNVIIVILKGRGKYIFSFISFNVIFLEVYFRGIFLWWFEIFDFLFNEN